MFHRKHLPGLVSYDEKIQEFQKHFVNIHKLIYYGFMIEPYSPGINKTRHIGLWKYRRPNRVMDGSLVHKQEGQSLGHVVYTLQRLPTPGQVNTWLLTWTSNPVCIPLLWKPSLYPRPEVSFPPLNPRGMGALHSHLCC